MLELWQPGMGSRDLLQLSLQSGRFPNIAARRLRNFVVEGFARCYLRDDAAPARLLKRVHGTLVSQAFDQILFVFNCRAHLVLADFVRDVYWPAYSAGRASLSNAEARAFVVRANQDGRTSVLWSDNSIQRVARYLTGYCADFGLLEGGIKQTRRIMPFRIEPDISTILAYDLHFRGHGDNSVLSHPDWTLFGMTRDDVLDEMKRLALKGLLIVQSAGGITRISWLHKSMEELANVLAHG